MATRFQRVLLKLSGEALMGDANFGIDPLVAQEMARQIRAVHELETQLGIVIGGGN
ncbi:MAG: UMP kinase, partial [Chloroflexota bacterium]|nr:UMP kinase [Chloroflexota bacterium]